MKLITLLVVILSSQPLAARLVVEQGAVGRWGGGEATRCLYLGKTYAATGGYCYYPVDMDRQPGYHEIGMVSDGQLRLATLEVQAKPCELERIDFPDPSYVTLSAADRERHWTEQWQVKAVFKNQHHEGSFDLPLQPPAQPLPTGDNFAVCREFNGIKKHRHTGVDYPIGMDHPVLAVAEATVALVADHFFTGKAVYLDHGNGLVTMYFHLNDTQVTVGQQVETGDVIGLIGSTGRSTGPHLHVGARWLNQRIDPNLLLVDPASLPSL